MFQPSQQLTQLTGLVPAPGAELLRIVIAGEAEAREELASMAGTFDDVIVLADVESDERLAARVNVLSPDVLLCDVGEEGTALTAIPRLATPSLLRLARPNQRAVALAAGARGVINRSATARKIHAALRAVGEGLLVSDEPSKELLPDEMSNDSLTAREHDVLRLLAAGLTNKEIAQRLRITEHTVKFHVNAILGKLHAETRTEAVVSAVRRGIVVL